MKLVFKKREIFDLTKAWIAISLAFGILSMSIFAPYFGILTGFLFAFFVSLITAGLGFIIHELSHKFVAQKFYCSAEFKANNIMLLFAILMSFGGFIFAAPGAVEINGAVNRKQNGLISFSGPFSNFVLALLFLPGFIFLENFLLNFFFFQGFFINAWLGFFNMIPFVPFDGQKIFKWNKFAYFSLIVALVLMVGFGLNLF